jgi:hypothetical protein
MTLLDPNTLTALLSNEDFPADYVHHQHPEDFKPLSSPLPVNAFYHEDGKNRKLHMRVSFKVSDTLFIPMSFVLDTGAPMYFYLSCKARELLKAYGLVFKDETDVERLNIHYKLKDGTERRFGAPIEVTSDSKDPANIMGLSTLMRLGLQINQDEVKFGNQFEWL